MEVHSVVRARWDTPVLVQKRLSETEAGVGSHKDGTWEKQS